MRISILFGIELGAEAKIFYYLHRRFFSLVPCYFPRIVFVMKRQSRPSKSFPHSNFSDSFLAP